MSLADIVQTVENNKTDYDGLFKSARALLSAADEGRLDQLPRPEMERLIEKLLLSGPHPGEPPVLAHAAASLITAGNEKAVTEFTMLAAPALQSLLDRPAPYHSKDLVVFLLVIRNFLPDTFDQQEISRLHLDWFSRFLPEDFSPPYNVMFHSRFFGRNRDDLADAFFRGGEATWRRRDLRPHHLLMLTWLGQRDLFDAPDNADLFEFLERWLPGEEIDRAAARSLAVRCFVSDGMLTPARLETLGLGDVLKTCIAAANARRLLPAARPAKGGARWMQARPYQAIQAARAKIAAGLHAPVIAGRRRLRVAVCISGQLRGFARAAESWRRTLLRNVDASFFVHSWTRVGRSNADPSRYVLPFAGEAFPDAYRKAALSIGFEDMQARYPVLFERLAAGGVVDKAAVEEVYPGAQIVLDDDRDDPFTIFSNQEKMHYKIWAANQLAQDAGEFDLVLRIRPDLEIEMLGFSWGDILEACRAGPVLFAEKPAGVHYGGMMIGDQFALTLPATMAIYAGAWETYPAFAKAGLAGVPKEFTGHNSLAMTAWLQGVSVERAPVKFGKLLDASPMQSPEILQALEENANYNDEHHEKLVLAVRKDLSHK